RAPQPADFYGFGRDFYRENANEMGGCLGPVVTPRQPGIKALVQHISLADRLCRAPAKLMPDGLTARETTPAGVDRLADHRARRVMIINASGGMRTTPAFHASPLRSLNPFGLLPSAGPLRLGAVLRAGEMDLTYAAPSWGAGVMVPPIDDAARNFAVIASAD